MSEACGVRRQSPDTSGTALWIPKLSLEQLDLTAEGAEVFAEDASKGFRKGRKERATVLSSPDVPGIPSQSTGAGTPPRR